MVLFAFSLQDQVDKFGAYVGIAAFFGLAILTLLYFAQAREVKRLREWAGRAPERAAELELAVAEHAEEARRTPPTPVPARQPAAAPVRQAAAAQALSPSVATNGAVKLQPAEVAALAFARAAGVHEPHVPTHHGAPAPVPTAAVATAPPAEVAVAAAALANGEPAAAQAINGGGGGIPAPATPAARRADPQPLPPRRTNVPPRRAPAPPPRRESNTRAVGLTAVIGVLVLVGCVFLLTRVLGGDDPTTPPKPNVVATPTAEDGTTAEASATASAAPAPTKDTALVGIYNGTGTPNLAATQLELLLNEGYPKDNLGALTAPQEQQRATSVVMYRRGNKAIASSVADTLGMTEIKQVDDATQALIAKAPKRWDVVVIVGADKSP